MTTLKRKAPGSAHEALSEFFTEIGVKRAADFEGVRVETIYKGLDPDQVGDFSFLRLARLTERFRSLVLADYLARRGGGVVLKLEAAQSEETTLGRISGAAMRETAEVFAELGQAMEDGRITSVEYARLEKEIHAAIEKLVLLLWQLRAEASLG